MSDFNSSDLTIYIALQAIPPIPISLPYNSSPPQKPSRPTIKGRKAPSPITISPISHLRRRRQSHSSTNSTTLPKSSITRQHRRRRCNPSRSTPNSTRGAVTGHYHPCAAGLTSSVGEGAGEGGSGEGEEGDSSEAHGGWLWGLMRRLCWRLCDVRVIFRQGLSCSECGSVELWW